MTACSGRAASSRDEHKNAIIASNFISFDCWNERNDSELLERKEVLDGNEAKYRKLHCSKACRILSSLLLAAATLICHHFFPLPFLFLVSLFFFRLFVGLLCSIKIYFHESVHRIHERSDHHVKFGTKSPSAMHARDENSSSS